MIVTTGQRVTRSFGSAVLSLSAMISCSKLRVSTSAPKFAASDFAVSRSIAELIVIIRRRSSSALRASLTRTSRRSARSFTVMPSEKVMVRVIGGGAACAGACCGRCSASRFWAGFSPDGRCCCCGRNPGRIGGWPGRCGMPVVGRTGCDGSGRGPPSIAAVLLCSGRGDPYGRCPCGRARLPVAACGGRGGAGGTTRGGCGTSCRFGCSGGALGGAFPGSSTRKRMLGGTKRPAFSRAISAAGSALAAAAGSSWQPARRAEPRQPERGAASTGVSSTTGGGAGASTGGATASSGFGSTGFALLISRGGPSVGAAGFGGSGAGAAAPFLPGAAFAFDAVLACFTACSENMSPFGRVMPFCLAMRSTNWRATISSSVLDALLSSMPWFFFNNCQHVIAGDVEKLSDLVNPNSGQT